MVRVIVRLPRYLVEACKLLTQLDLIGDVRDTLSVTNTDGLLDPDHVCEVHPSIWILNWAESAGLPLKGPIFIQKSGERATTGATVEPVERGSVHACSATTNLKTDQIVTSSEASGLADGKNLGKG